MWVGMLVSSVSAAYWRRCERLSRAGAGRGGDAVKGGDVKICRAKVYVVAYWCIVLLCAGRGGGGGSWPRVGGSWPRLHVRQWECPERSYGVGVGWCVLCVC